MFAVLKTKLCPLPTSGRKTENDGCEKLKAIQGGRIVVEKNVKLTPTRARAKPPAALAAAGLAEALATVLRCRSCAS